MQDFQRLIGEHDQMDLLAIRLADAVRQSPDVARVLALRSELSLTLDDHLSNEDGFIYNDLISQRLPGYPIAVERFHDSFADLAADWGDYLRGWDEACIAADWNEFADLTIHMMDRLRSRIAEENALLYPMALRGGGIRLRMAA